MYRCIGRRVYLVYSRRAFLLWRLGSYFRVHALLQIALFVYIDTSLPPCLIAGCQLSAIWLLQSWAWVVALAALPFAFCCGRRTFCSVAVCARLLPCAYALANYSCLLFFFFCGPFSHALVSLANVVNIYLTYSALPGLSSLTAFDFMCLAQPHVFAAPWCIGYQHGGVLWLHLSGFESQWCLLSVLTCACLLMPVFGLILAWLAFL